MDAVNVTKIFTANSATITPIIKNNELIKIRKGFITPPITVLVFVIVILLFYLLRNNLSKHSNSNNDSQDIVFKITNDDYGNEEGGKSPNFLLLMEKQE